MSPTCPYQRLEGIAAANGALPAALLPDRSLQHLSQFTLQANGADHRAVVFTLG